MTATTIPSRKFGDTHVGAVGYGAMNLTWAPTQTPDEQAFATIKTAVNLGGNFINSGEFYGQPDGTLGLQLLSRFFAAEPTYADKVVLSVKGGLRPDYSPDASLEGLRKSVENINRLLTENGGQKKMDLFEPARVDKTRPIEEIMKNLTTLRDEGHYKFIGLSEVSGETLRKAAAAGTVTAVEVEYSPWALDPEKNGVLAACKEFGIALIAYSPLGRGFLTGAIKSPDDLPEGDMRKRLDRFQAENWDVNMQLVHKLEAIAKKKGVSSTQLAIAWNLSQWEGIIPIPGSRRVEGVKESVGAGNIKMTEEELKEVREVLDSAKIVGGRYNKHMEGSLSV